MTWDGMKKSLKESKERAGFVSLKDGESVTGVFRGEPYEYYQKFGDPTEYEAPAKGLGYKFKVNFVTKTPEGNYAAKIFQGGRRVSEALLPMVEALGLDQIYTIQRSGSGIKDTRYAIIPKGPLTPEKLAEVSSVPLMTLERPQPEEDDVPHPADGATAQLTPEEVPF